MRHRGDKRHRKTSRSAKNEERHMDNERVLEKKTKLGRWGRYGGVDVGKSIGEDLAHGVHLAAQHSLEELLVALLLCHVGWEIECRATRHGRGRRG